MSRVKKMIAPIIVILLIGGILFAQIFGLFKAAYLFQEAGYTLLIIIGILVILLILLLVTLFKRIKEIKDGEEDDLDKY